jgi:sRNA-binding carbon storage regulator CsrA
MGLLCLACRVDREIVVTMPDGRRGKVVVLSAEGSQARLGFDFPRDVEINRDRVQWEIDDERRRDTEDGGTTP